MLPSSEQICRVREVDNPIIRMQTFYSGVSPIRVWSRTVFLGSAAIEAISL